LEISIEETLTTNILLVSAGFFHPPWLGRFWLRQTLQALPDVRLRQVSSLEELLASGARDYQAIVLYIHQQKISSAALEVLDHFIDQGGGLLAIHSATASFKGKPEYFAILGGRFTGHGPLCELEVRPVKMNDEIFTNIGPFMLNEEPYEHELDPACVVHFDARHPEAKTNNLRLPVVWTRFYGQGRVCYCLPGHRSAAMRHPVVREILQRGLNWACRHPADGGSTQ
jgi:type 1 glutamine amidotransferase